MYCTILHQFIDIKYDGYFKIKNILLTRIYILYSLYLQKHKNIFEFCL